MDQIILLGRGKLSFRTDFDGGQQPRKKREGFVYEFGKRARGCMECSKRCCAFSFHVEIRHESRTAQMAEQTDRREPVSRARIFPGATRLPMIASHNRKDARINLSVML